MKTPKKLIWWIFVILIMAFLLASIYIHYECKFYHTISINKVKKICKTGDLVLFRWSHVDIGFRLFSKFCHVGMIYKNKRGKSFIIETHPEEKKKSPQKSKKGVNIYPLKKRLQNYGGSFYLIKLDPQIQINRSIIKNNINVYKKIPFDDDFRYNFVKSWFYNKFNWTNCQKNSMYCSELIAQILKDLDIINKDLDNSTFSPTTFIDLHKNNKKIFGKIYKITV